MPGEVFPPRGQPGLAWVASRAGPWDSNCLFPLYEGG